MNNINSVRTHTPVCCIYTMWQPLNSSSNDPLRKAPTVRQSLLPHPTFFLDISWPHYSVMSSLKLCIFEGVVTLSDRWVRIKHKLAFTMVSALHVPHLFAHFWICQDLCQENPACVVCSHLLHFCCIATALSLHRVFWLLEFFSLWIHF